jgi:hypothetical protein
MASQPSLLHTCWQIAQADMLGSASVDLCVAKNTSYCAELAIWCGLCQRQGCGELTSCRLRMPVQGVPPVGQLLPALRYAMVCSGSGSPTIHMYCSPNTHHRPAHALPNQCWRGGGLRPAPGHCPVLFILSVVVHFLVECCVGDVQATSRSRGSR